MVSATSTLFSYQHEGEDAEYYAFDAELTEDGALRIRGANDCGENQQPEIHPSDTRVVAAAFAGWLLGAVA
jgi:hypothetical protein